MIPLLLACATPPDDPPPTPLALEAGSEAATEVAGEPLARLVGGGLAAPLAVPLWLEPSDVDGVPTRLGWFELPGGRWYLHQSGPGGGTPCRVLDAATGALASAPACAQTAFLSSTFETVRPGLAVAWSSGEGCGQVELLRWTDEAGAEVIVSRSLGCAGGTATWRRDGDGVVLRASCDLDQPGCPASDAIPEHVFRWTPDAGLRRG